ncbi:hypothetical protein H5410_004627 [Solanum commersonii]|uniref:Uncharacterized protein n=1 Tax=Solanum commersonii TaxID=4109 RepID=A0A9J6B896_SOLCO|nr:hypothetical protein H5410_004627 [Solanum commersonii]
MRKMNMMAEIMILGNLIFMYQIRQMRMRISPFDKGAHEDPYAHSNLEDFCCSHLLVPLAANSSALPHCRWGASSCLCGTVMQLCWHQQDVKASTLSKSFILGRDPVDKIM